MVQFNLILPILYLGTDAPPGAVFQYLPYSARLKSWVGLITLVVACIMSTSAVDSMQNGLTSCITNHWFRDQNIFFARFIVFCVNVPVVIVATRKYKVLQLFLIANMLTTCWFLPLLSGLFDWSTEFVGETGVLFSGSTAILSTIFYAAGRWWWKVGNYRDAFDCGSWYAWFGNISYTYDYFLVASGSSVIAMIFWGSCKLLLKRVGIQGPGISAILANIPGFGFITGSGLGFDLMEKIGLGRFNGPKAPSHISQASDEKVESEDKKMVEIADIKATPL